MDDLRFEGGAATSLPPPPPPATVTTVLSPDGATVVAADSIATAYGTNLATATAAAPDSMHPPLSLGGTSVSVKDASGTELPAALSYVSPTQVNFAVPAGLAPGTATVKVTNGLGVVTAGTVPIANVSPGLFSADATGAGVAAASIVRVHADGTQTFEQVAQYDAASKKFAAVPVDVSTDQVYLVLYGTGLRHAASVAVTIGGTPATVAYAGPQLQYPGLDQVNVLVPSSLAGRGSVAVQLTADGQGANAVGISVK